MGLIDILRNRPTPTLTGKLLVAIDLGQATDYTALVVVEQQDIPTGEPRWLNLGNPEADPRQVQDTQSHYRVRHLERWLGVNYVEQVARVAKIMARPELADAPLVIDRTGVGIAVVDAMRAAGLHPIGVNIHGGATVSHEGDNWSVPKRDLVTAVAMLLQARRLEIAPGLSEAKTLTNELRNFRVTIDPKTAHDSYASWRESAHDDLVLATALALWAGENAVGAPAHIWFA